MNESDTGGLAARGVALDLLQDVLRRSQALDLRLEGAKSFAGLPARDRAFAHNLVATALRRLGQIDAVIAAFLERPLARGAQVPQDILRLGVAQLLFTEVPGHAAVDTAVRLVRERGSARFDDLVNALLRRAQREAAGLVAGQDAARLNTPDWLWQSWQAAYGDDACRAIAAAHLSPAPLDLTVKADPAAWADRLGGSVVAAGTVRLADPGPVRELQGYDDGAWWVQDAAAALPARLLGRVQDLRVLDLCAAPGGKTAQLAAGGAQVTAVDRAARRLDILKANLARLGLTAEMVLADVLDWSPAGTFDAILLDAPCSATGTIRRHPDLAHTKTAADVAKLAVLQGRLLARAADWLRPGGTLVFATCSLQPEEGPAQAAAFLAARPDFRRQPLAPGEIAGIGPEMISPEGDLRTLPCHLAAAGGMDGFFAARLRRREDGTVAPPSTG